MLPRTHGCASGLSPGQFCLCEAISGAQWEFLELSRFQVVPKLLGSQAWCGSVCAAVQMQAMGAPCAILVSKGARGALPHALPPVSL